MKKTEKKRAEPVDWGFIVIRLTPAARGLVLVGDGLPLDARIEGVPWQRRRGGDLLGEAVADDERAGGRLDRAPPLIATSIFPLNIEIANEMCGE